jgi:hypothetical protein
MTVGYFYPTAENTGFYPRAYFEGYTLRGVSPAFSVAQTGPRHDNIVLPQSYDLAGRLYIPIPHEHGLMGVLMTQLLNHGSRQTDVFLKSLKEREGITLETNGYADALVVSINGPAKAAVSWPALIEQYLTLPLRNPPDQFSIQREHLLHELNIQRDQPSIQLNEKMMTLYFGENQEDSRSTSESIEALGLVEVNQVTRYYQNLLGSLSAPAALFVHPQSVSDIVPPYQNQGRGVQSKTVSPGSRIEPGHVGPVKVPNQSVNQSLLQWLIRAPKVTDPKYPAFMVLMQLMEDTGLIHQTLRTEAGLIYGSMTEYINQNPQHPVYRIQFAVDFDKTPEALKLFQQLLSRVEKGQLKEEQVKKAKEKLRLDIASHWQTAQDILDLNQSRLAAGMRAFSLAQWLEIIDRVSFSEVKALCKDIFSSKTGRTACGVLAPQFVLDRLPTQ